jgi:hypothetical protein
MKNILFILFCAFISHSAYSQEELVLKHGKKTVHISQNTQLKIKSTENELKEGELKIIDSSMICIGSDTLNIEELKSVFFKSKKNTFFSLVTVGIGGLYTGLFGYLLINAAITETAIIGAIIGTVVFVPILILTSSATIYGIIRLIRGKQYKNTKWQFEIANIKI